LSPRPSVTQTLNLEHQDRRRIAAELRESTSQELAALKWNLVVIKKSASQLGPKASKALSECFALANHCSQELGMLAHLLHPSSAEEFQLVSALQAYCEGLTRRSPLQLRLAVDGCLRQVRLPKEFERALFRVVQEALANVRLHSGSKTAEIELRRDFGSDEIVLKIKDNGHGIPAKLVRSMKKKGAASSGLGILSIKERVKQLDGRFILQTSKHGTHLTVTLPLPGKTRNPKHSAKSKSKRTQAGAV
jgi:signal transduction histidine kinase